MAHLIVARIGDAKTYERGESMRVFYISFSERGISFNVYILTCLNYAFIFSNEFLVKFYRRYNATPLHF